MTIPFVITKKDGLERQYDVFSLLLSDRIVFLNGLIDDTGANSIIAQLLYLNAEDSEKEISLYINSPGGTVSAGLAVYDTMRNIKAPVHTIGIGLVASMASLILAGGNKRFVLPHSKIMIHQPTLTGGIEGKETDISIIAKNLTSTRRTIAEIIAKHTGKTVEGVERDIENDKYMTAEETVKYGIADEIIPIC